MLQILEFCGSFGKDLKSQPASESGDLSLLLFLGFKVLWAPKKWEQHIFIFWWWHLVTMPCRPQLNPLADRSFARIMKSLGSVELYLVKETNSGGHHTLTIRFLLYGAVITAWVWPLLQIKPCRRFWKIGGESIRSSAVKRNYVDRKGGKDKKTDRQHCWRNFEMLLMANMLNGGRLKAVWLTKSIKIVIF